MDRLVGVIAFVLLLMLAPATFAEETVKEAETGVEFKVVDEQGRTLLGTGVREKFGFDVYAIAVYAKPSDVRSQMGGAKDPVHALVYGDMSRRIILHFVRTAPGKKIQQNFAETLKLRLTRRQFDVTCKEDYDRLLKAVGSGVGKGERILLDFKGRTLRVFNNEGIELYQTDNVDFARAIYNSFLDERTNSPTLPEGVRRFFASGT